MLRHDLIQDFIQTSAQTKRLLARLSAVSVEEKIATALQCQALKYLEGHSPATVGRLAAELGMSSPAVAQLSDRLVNSGWVARRHDTRDRRIVDLSLTPAGRSELAQMNKKYAEKMGRFLSLIPETDLRELIRIQKELIDKLEIGDK